MDADAIHGERLRRGFGHQTMQLLVELGDSFGEPFWWRHATERSTNLVSASTTSERFVSSRNRETFVTSLAGQYRRRLRHRRLYIGFTCTTFILLPASSFGALAITSAHIFFAFAL